MNDGEIIRLGTMLENVVHQSERRDAAFENLVNSNNQIMRDLNVSIIKHEHTIKDLAELQKQQYAHSQLVQDHETRIGNIEVARQALIYLAGILAPIFLSGLGTAVWFYWKNSS